MNTKKINLHSFSGRSLQDARSILLLAKKRNMNLDDLLILLNNRFGKVSSVIGPGEICPYCGGLLFHPSGMPKQGVSTVISEILICKKCRYSKYIGE